MCKVPLRYLKNLLQASQWLTVGAAKNWLSLFIGNAISILAKVAYYKAPIELWQSVISAKDSLSALLGGITAAIGVEQGVQPCIWKMQAINIFDNLKTQKIS